VPRETTSAISNNKLREEKEKEGGGTKLTPNCPTRGDSLAPAVNALSKTIAKE